MRVKRGPTLPGYAQRRMSAAGARRKVDASAGDWKDLPGTRRARFEPRRGRARIARVTQRTVVLKVPASRGAEIERRLVEQRFEIRTAPYALYSARGEGVVATHYSSGKFVVQ